MAVKVRVFEPDYNEEHQRVLRALAAGIPGAEVRPVTEYEPCDVAVIFGLVKRSFELTWAKRAVLERHEGRALLVVEAGFLGRGRYYTVGFGGINGHADFRTDGVASDRWERLVAEGVARPRSWREQTEGAVAVCGQLPWDCAVQDTPHVEWCRSAVEGLLAAGARVAFRPHPRHREPEQYGVDSKLWDTRPLERALDDYRAVVTWNSNSGVEAAVAGVPVIACDRGSAAWPVAAHTVLSPLMRPDRERWLAGLGYSQWTLEEMREGLPWRHLTR